MTADRGPGSDLELGIKEGADLSQARIDALSATTEGPTDKSIGRQIGDENVRALRAAHSYRRALVQWTLWTVGGLTLAATVFMGLYIGSQWGDVQPSVMVAYFASVVTETIGILYVIARYLFPPSGPSS